MLAGYKVGYIAGRFFTRMVKFYLASKVINGTVSKAGRLAKHHKIDSKTAEVVTENGFECLDYLDQGIIYGLVQFSKTGISKTRLYSGQFCKRFDSWCN